MEYEATNIHNETIVVMMFCGVSSRRLESQFCVARMETSMNCIIISGYRDPFEPLWNSVGFRLGTEIKLMKREWYLSCQMPTNNLGAGVFLI